MRNETDSDAVRHDRPDARPDADRVGGALDASLDHAAAPGPFGAAGERARPPRDADAARASRERAASEARGAAETAALGTVAGSMVLGALYPTSVSARDADGPARGDREPVRHEDGQADRRDGGAASPAGTEQASVRQHEGLADGSGGASAPSGSDSRMPHDPAVAEPAAAGDTSTGTLDLARPAAGADRASDPAPGANADVAPHTSGAASSVVAGLAPAPAQDAADVARSLLDQATTLATPGGMPPAVGLPDLADLANPARPDVLLDALPRTGLAAGVVRNAADSLADPVTSLADPVLAQALDGVAGRTEPLLRDVADVASAVPDLASDVAGSLVAPLVQLDLKAVDLPAVEPAAASILHAASGLPVADVAPAPIGSAASGVDDVASDAVAGVAQTASRLAQDVSSDDGAAPLGPLTGAASATLHQVADVAVSPSAAVGRLTDAVADAGESVGQALSSPGAVHALADPVKIAGLDGGRADDATDGASPSARSAIDPVADRAAAAVGDVTSAAGAAVGDVLGTGVAKGADDDRASDRGSAAGSVSDTAAKTTSASDDLVKGAADDDRGSADGVGSAVGKALGGAIDLGPAAVGQDDASAPSSTRAGDDAADGGSRADAPGQQGSGSDVGDAAADIVQAAPIHVGFAGQSYVEDLDSQDHGLASANGMLHGLV